MRKANYETLSDFDALSEVKLNIDNVVIIRDLGPWDQHPTVTNDAENVVQELIKAGILTENKRLFYYDSEDELSELIVKDNKFLGFGPA